MPPAIFNASGNRPHNSAASKRAGGGCSGHCSPFASPPERISSSNDSSSERTPHCTSVTPGTRPLRRVVTTSADPVSPCGSIKLRQDGVGPERRARVGRRLRGAAAPLASRCKTNPSPEHLSMHVVPDVVEDKENALVARRRSELLQP
eukprot:2347482-Prymnesium_polylepis.1